MLSISSAIYRLNWFLNLRFFSEKQPITNPKMSVDILPSCSSLYDSADKSMMQQREHYHAEVKTTSSSSSRTRSSRHSTNKYETTFVQNTVALAVISKLHSWCCQLFWLAIVCVIGCELNSNKRKTLQDVRRNIFNSSNRRSKTLTDLEMQVIPFSPNRKLESVLESL